MRNVVVPYLGWFYLTRKKGPRTLVDSKNVLQVLTHKRLLNLYYSK